jgi:hypothetical protein
MTGNGILLFAATYAAFCRAYGIHTTGVAGYHNWNEEAIEIMCQELSDPWNTFEQVLGGRSTHITTSINSAVDSASNHLGTNPPCRQPPRF